MRLTLKIKKKKNSDPDRQWVQPQPHDTVLESSRIGGGGSKFDKKTESGGS